MRTLRIKNWDQFQHYKDRNPPWIKLATDTFQNYDFGHLDDASKLLAVCIWTLAARSKEGTVPYDLRWIKGQCNLGDLITDRHLQELVKSGYLVTESEPLAGCTQNDCPETEGETEAERETDSETKPRRGKNETRKRNNPTHLADSVTRVLPDEWREFARGLGWTDWQISRVWDGFWDYWTSANAKNPAKKDWAQTWRNWCRDKLPPKDPNAQKPKPTSSGVQFADELERMTK